MKKDINKTITVYVCDLCGEQEEEINVSICQRCQRELCWDCAKIFDFNPVGDYNFTIEYLICKECKKEAKKLNKEFEREFNKFMEKRMEKVKEFVG